MNQLAAALSASLKSKMGKSEASSGQSSSSGGGTVAPSIARKLEAAFRAFHKVVDQPSASKVTERTDLLSLRDLRLDLRREYGDRDLSYEDIAKIMRPYGVRDRGEVGEVIEELLGEGLLSDLGEGMFKVESKSKKRTEDDDSLSIGEDDDGQWYVYYSSGKVADGPYDTEELARSAMKKLDVTRAEDRDYSELPVPPTVGEFVETGDKDTEQLPEDPGALFVSNIIRQIDSMTWAVELSDGTGCRVTRDRPRSALFRCLDSKSKSTSSKTESTDRHCDIYKAVDGQWYMELSPREYDGREKATTYGPFASFDVVDEYLGNFSNPGSYGLDESGTAPVPTKSPNGDPVSRPARRQPDYYSFRSPRFNSKDPEKKVTESIDRDTAKAMFDARDLEGFCDPEEFYIGLNEELEHLGTVGGDINKVVDIVLDHLGPDPEYYTREYASSESKSKTENEVPDDGELSGHEDELSEFMPGDTVIVDNLSGDPDENGILGKTGRVTAGIWSTDAVVRVEIDSIIYAMAPTEIRKVESQSHQEIIGDGDGDFNPMDMFRDEIDSGLTAVDFVVGERVLYGNRLHTVKSITGDGVINLRADDGYILMVHPKRVFKSEALMTEDIPSLDSGKDGLPDGDDDGDRVLIGSRVKHVNLLGTVIDTGSGPGLVLVSLDNGSLFEVHADRLEVLESKSRKSESISIGSVISQTTPRGVTEYEIIGSSNLVGCVRVRVLTTTDSYRSDGEELDLDMGTRNTYGYSVIRESDDDDDEEYVSSMSDDDADYTVQRSKKTGKYHLYKTDPGSPMLGKRVKSADDPSEFNSSESQSRTESSYNYTANELWSMLVPDSGDAATPHGQLLLSAMRCQYEIYNNGGGNNYNRFVDHVDANKNKFFRYLRNFDSPEIMGKFLKKQYSNYRNVKDDVYEKVMAASDDVVQAVVQYINNEVSLVDPDTIDLTHPFESKKQEESSDEIDTGDIVEVVASGSEYHSLTGEVVNIFAGRYEVELFDQSLPNQWFQSQELKKVDSDFGESKTESSERTFRSVEDWKSAAINAGCTLTDNGYADPENGPSPNDIADVLFAVDASGEEVGYFNLYGGPDDTPGYGVLFSTSSEYMHHMHSGEAQVRKTEGRVTYGMGKTYNFFDDSLAETTFYKIDNQYGWAVSEQFVKCYDYPSEETFSEMNSNALRYIYKAIKDLDTTGSRRMDDVVWNIGEYLSGGELGDDNRPLVRESKSEAIRKGDYVNVPGKPHPYEVLKVNIHDIEDDQYYIKIRDPLGFGRDPNESIILWPMTEIDELTVVESVEGKSGKKLNRDDPSQLKLGDRVSVDSPEHAFNGIEGTVMDGEGDSFSVSLDNGETDTFKGGDLVSSLGAQESTLFPDWDSWFAEVNRESIRLCGLGVDDYDDFDYRMAFDAGDSPLATARAAIRASMDASMMDPDEWDGEPMEGLVRRKTESDEVEGGDPVVLIRKNPADTSDASVGDIGHVVDLAPTGNFLKVQFDTGLLIVSRDQIRKAGKDESLKSEESDKGYNYDKCIAWIKSKGGSVWRDNLSDYMFNTLYLAPEDIDVVMSKLVNGGDVSVAGGKLTLVNQESVDPVIRAQFPQTVIT